MRKSRGLALAASGTRPDSTADSACSNKRQWPAQNGRPEDEDEEIPDTSTAIVADRRDNRQLRIVNGTDLQVTDRAQPSKSPS